jgi:hypothetical protein
MNSERKNIAEPPKPQAAHNRKDRAMSVIERPTIAGLWTREGKFYRVWKSGDDCPLQLQEIYENSGTLSGCTTVDCMPTGNWRKLTSPAATSPEVKPFTPTKSTWQAGKEFKAWIARNTDATPDKIAEKALKIFSECGTAPPDAFPPRPAFVAPEKPDTLIRLKGGDGFSFWAHKRAGGYLAGNMIYRFEEYEAIDLKTGEVIA